MKIIIVNVAVASGVQVIWTFGYMFSLYIYNKTTTYNLFLFIIFFTILIMYKIVRILSYWLVTGCIITPILSFVWLQIDNSPFRDIPFGGIGEGLTPIFLPIFFVCFQASILMAIKIQNLLPHDKQKEKQALKITVIQDIKILCFQVLLSMVLAGVLILNNLFVSYLIITLSLYILFIIRKKISGNGIFWIISWIIIFDQTMTMIFQYFPEEARRYLEVTQRKFEIWYLIIFIVYHILLTNFFKLKAERGKSQNY